MQGPRPGEEGGKDYHFSNKEEMMEMMGNNDFIETAEFSGNMYGTSKKSVQDVLDNGNCSMIWWYHRWLIIKMFFDSIIQLILSLIRKNMYFGHRYTRR